MKKIFKEIFSSLLVTIFLVLVVSLAYPFTVYKLAALFKEKRDGSLITIGGQVIGSKLIGQKFSGLQYFHGRPSAAGEGYDTFDSGGLNLALTSDEYAQQLKKNIEDYRSINGINTGPLPIDAITFSSSGLDPHISLENALLQLKRVARERKMSEDKLIEILMRHVEKPDLGFLGNYRVNVLLLNLFLDGASFKETRSSQ